VPDSRHSDTVRREFERTAGTFDERTRGRFDAMDIVAFSRVAEDDLVLEVGAGTGNFLGLFEDVSSGLVALDLTAAMLEQSRSRFPRMMRVQADGARIPLVSECVDLVASAQALHHIWDPLPILMEMRRVVQPQGRVLIVDQVAPERYEEAVAMNELEIVRDPSHASSRPASAFRVLLRRAALEIIDERFHESVDRLSSWMWQQEFPAERIEAVRRFIAERGQQTGMSFERDGDDWVFTRRRMMILARRMQVK
jgi:ubiquinone/menaquinone biosynthesis C-methylase UbiE